MSSLSVLFRHVVQSLNPCLFQDFPAETRQAGLIPADSIRKAR
jgi:hypothetical protein